MYYHLADHVYITQFRDELILLDTKQDKYSICLESFSRGLMNLLEGESNTLLQSSFSAISIKNLVDSNIIKEASVPFPFDIDCKPHSDGVSNVDWALPLEDTKISFKWKVFKAFMTLLKVNFYVRAKGFYAAIQLLKRTQKKHKTYLIPNDEDLRRLAEIINKACLIYPTRTKCLEWAMTFVLLALDQKWKCNLEIGVQNYPFLAHAWVECNGKVVMDSQDLRSGLSIILNEPFRKLKS